MVWWINVFLYVCPEQQNNETMKNFIPHSFIAITSFIACASTEASQMFIFATLTAGGLMFMYRKQIGDMLRR